MIDNDTTGLVDKGRYNARPNSRWDHSPAEDRNGPPPLSAKEIIMAVLSFAPLIVITSIESVGVLLLAREVLIGHKVEEIASDLSPLQRLQFLYAAEDYRGFLIEVSFSAGCVRISSLEPSTGLSQANSRRWSRASGKAVGRILLAASTVLNAIPPWLRGAGAGFLL
jgi:hypothetical protein